MRGVAFLLIGLAGIVSATVPAPPNTPPSAQVPPFSARFELQTLDGHLVTDATYRGRWLLIYFGYTFCPDVCPTVLVDVGQALNALGPLADRIQPIFITVDPARDTASHMAQYLRAFSPRIVGLRGNAKQIETTSKQFHTYYRARNLGDGTYAVDHSSFLYVISPDGHVAKVLPDSLRDQKLAEELRQLVQ
jgi:cytochrome oxidase Cu insertion factor (SCO1/SenC/PrrC family)